VLNDTTRVLDVAPPDAQGYNATSFDPGVAFSADGAELAAAFRRHRLEAGLENATSPFERERVLSTAMDGLSDRLSELRARERAATRAYAAGDISGRAFLVRLARVQTAARALDAALEPVVAASRSADETAFERAKTLSQTAESLTGPVRATLASGVRSTTASATVYTAASDDGVVLARVVPGTGGPTYVRETVRFDNRDDDPGTTFESASDFYDFMSTRYPQATAGPPSLSIEFPGGVHRFEMRHSLGTLTAHVDGSARGVAREIHRLRVDALSVSDTANESADGLAVRVNRTFAGGPLEVTVRDASGDRVDASVSVGDATVGETGVDGTLWTVAPHGETAVTVSVDGSTVSVALD
jgi:hypothetical protein